MLHVNCDEPMASEDSKIFAGNDACNPLAGQYGDTPFDAV